MKMLLQMFSSESSASMLSRFKPEALCKHANVCAKVFASKRKVRRSEEVEKKV
jgi:hypothetical protein